jgi:hypothetical protein
MAILNELECSADALSRESWECPHIKERRPEPNQRLL